jgi:DeoR family transcriptional regulator, fructose operon transcriptional repressor
MAYSKQHDLAPERHDRVRALIRAQGAVRLSEICSELHVSPATARRDLEELERRGELRRVHGGAVSVHNALEEPVFDDKAQLGASEKRRIAEAALEFIRGGDTIYLDGGSTVLELAALLCHRTDVTVVTNSVRVVQELGAIGPRLIMIGGELRRLSQAVVGPLTRAAFEHLRVDKAFMGTLGLTLEEGLTTTDPDEAYTKELAMSRAGQVILLVDGSKVGKVGLSRAGELGAINLVITDKGMNPQFARQLRKTGLDIVQV